MRTELKTLIIDENKSDIAIYIRLLGKDGFKVSYKHVETEKQFRQSLKKSKWDIILSDAKLPMFNASAALDILKEYKLDIPFIVITEARGKDIVIELMKKGACDFLSKKKLTSLAQVVRHEISEARSRVENTTGAKTNNSGNDQFKILFENAPIGIGVADLKGNLLTFNDAMLKPGNYSRQDIEKIGNVNKLYYNPKQRTKVLKLFRQQGFIKNYHVQFKRSDETPYDALLSLTSINFGGQPCVQALVEDISELKQAEQKVFLMNFALNNVHEAAFLIDEQSHFHFVNEESCRSLGYSCEELLNMSVPDIDIDFPIEKWPDTWNKLKTHGSLTFEGRHKTKSGNIFPVEINANFFVYSGSSYILALVRNITEHKSAVENLNKTNQLLESIFDSTHVLIAYLDTQFNFIRVNNAYASADEQEPSFFPGRNHFELYPDDENKTIFQNVVKTGQPYFATAKPFEYAGHPDRGISHWDWSLLPIKNFNGEIEGLILTLLNVTERIKAEEALREREEFLSSIIENIPNMIFIKDAKELRFVRINEACEKLSGHKREDLIGKNDYDFFKKEQADFFSKIDRQVLESGQMFEVPAEPIDTKTDRRILRTKKIPLYDKKGNPAFLLGISDDITEQKQSEKALRESEEKYRLIVENAYDGIEITQADSIIFFNFRFADMLGYTREELNNIRFSQFYTEQAEKDYNERQAIRAKGFAVPTNYETSLRKKDGSVIDVDVKYEIIDYLGKPATFAIIRDITEHKRNFAINTSRLHLMQFAEEHSINELLEETINEAEKLTNSSTGFYHFVGDDQESLILQNWSTITKEKFCKTEGNVKHSPINKAGIWVDCINQRKAVIHNDFVSLPGHKGTPEGHVELIRQLVVPVMRGDKIKAVLGVGNKLSLYTEKDAEVISQLAHLAWEIAQRKLVNEALRESQKKYKNLFDYSPIGIYQSNVNGEIMFANDRFAKILGYESAADLLNLNLEKKVYCEPSDRLKIMNQIESGDVQTDFELKWKKKNGQPIWILNSIRIIRDESGDILNFEGFVRDIDLWKKNEAELVKLSTAVAQSPASIIITDLDGNIEYVNKTFEDTTGFTWHEAFQNNPRILKSDQMADEEYKDLWQTIISGNTWHGELLNKKKNGELFWEYAFISPVKDKYGKTINYLAIKQDITEKKKIMQELITAKEKAEAMNRVKNIFFTNMSHELRTPFVGIMGFAELLSLTLTDSEAKEMADGILRTARRMKDTLTKILNLSKLEFNEIELVLQKIDIKEIVSTTYEHFIPAANEKNLLLKTSIDIESSIMETDETILTEILNNLVNNAIIYTNEGSVEISAGKKIIDNKDLLVLKVTDTGIGIPKEKQEIIWEEFRQVSEGSTRSYQGTGLGLSIVKKYTELIGGKIYLESEEGKGSTFTLELPILIPDLTNE